MSKDNNNSDKKLQRLMSRWKYYQKQAHVVRLNCEDFIEKFGIHKIGILTLTFGDCLYYDNAYHWQEAQRRYNNFRRRYIQQYFKESMAVLEPQASGRIHFHILVVCEEDIKTGYDFEAAKHKDYRSASPYLRGLWSMLREKLPLYGFGRHELQPLKCQSSTIADYVGKYLSAELGEVMNDKPLGFKGRKVRYSQGWKHCNTQFTWNTKKSRQYRHMLEKVAAKLGMKTMDDFKTAFGSRWAYKLRDVFAEAVIHGVDEKIIIHLKNMKQHFLSRSAIQRRLSVQDCDDFRPGDSPPYKTS